MHFLQENMNIANVNEAVSPLSKRRRFAPLPTIIPTIDNSDIEHHVFESPLILQMCEQAPLPAEIEAELLQVGMRIRKSVAEGYRTKKFTPRPFFNYGRLSPQTQAALMGSNNENEEPCGQEVNMNIQPLSTVTFCGVNLAAIAHLSDDWSSMQEQKLWSYSTSHKRGFENDSDSDDSPDWQPQTPSLDIYRGTAMPVDYFNIDPDTMGNVSPLTHIGEPQIPGRRMAKPKSKIRAQPQIQAVVPPTSAWNPFANFNIEQPQPQPLPQPVNHYQGHRRILSCGVEANMMMSMNDFSEASFLQRREDVEMDCS